MANIVFIATSLDGYIADREGQLDWLHEIPNPDKEDCGYGAFMERMDAIVMGRNSFETVLGFDCDWPYTKPVFVLSHSLDAIPSSHESRATLMNGIPEDITTSLNQSGHQNLYIDGGKTIQGFLKAGLIDELIITTLPILLGGGSRLFGELAHPLRFRLTRTETFLDALVQNHYSLRT